MLLYEHFARQISGRQYGLIIYIHHYIPEPGKHPHIVLPPRDKPYTAHEVCQVCAAAKNIGPFTFHLYALYNPIAKCWLAPNDEILSHQGDTKEFIFRIRFQPHESQFRKILKKDKETFNYYFYQCRNDFVHGELNHHFHNIDQKDVLGLVVLDIFHYCKEKNCSEEEFKNSKLCSDNFPDFLPDATCESFKLVLSKMKLRRSILKKLSDEFRNERKYEIMDIKWRYMSSLWRHIPNYATEDFRTKNSEGSMIRIQMVPTVEPSVPAIYTKSEGSAEFTLFAYINELTDVSRMQRGKEYIVIMNRTTGIPETALFSWLEETQAFMSCLDGYYRMTEDYYHHLSQDVTSPMLKELHQLRCHGPIERKWAVRQLKKTMAQGGQYQYNFIVAQSFSDLNPYTLTFFAQDSIMCQPINTLQNGKLQLRIQGEPMYDSLQDLLLGYAPEKQHGTIRLKTRIPPRRPYDPALYLCKKYVEEEEEANNSAPTKSIKNMVHLVHHVDITQHNIGEGHFTVVHKGMLHIENETLTVAVKQLKPQASAVLQELMACMHACSQWQHTTIMAVRGVCLAPPCQLLMEYAEYGCLSDYLRRNYSRMRVIDLVLTAEQIAQALLYLQEERTPCVHGNIRCRNILVFENQASTEIQVKLGDPGLASLYSRPFSTFSPGLTAELIQTERLPWVAPECYPLQLPNTSCAPPTIYSDRFAFATTLWEIFSTGDVPYAQKSANQIMNSVRTKQFLPRPPQCPQGMYDIMLNCWQHNPEARDSPKLMVRNIRSVRYEDTIDDMLLRRGTAENQYAETGATALLSPVSLLKSAVSPPHAPPPAVQNGFGPTSRPLPIIPHELGPEIMANQLRVDESRKLGEGHYGEVFKGEYAGKLVAVKRLKAKDYKKCKKDFDREFRTMLKLRHPHIVQIEGCCRNWPGYPMLIVMEFMEKGCLQEYVRRQRGRNQEVLYRFMAEICEGMQYLTSQKVIHRDLAARNVLVSKHETLKISDFGLSRFMGEDRDYYRCNSRNEIPIRWSSPEVMTHRKYSEKSDIWSFSITTWEIFTYGSPPRLSDDDRRLHQLLESNRRLPLDEVPENVRHIIRACWDYNPDLRPTFARVQEMITSVRQRLSAIGN